MTLSEELTWRGFVNQTTLKNITDLDKTPITFYWGVDPSADSMHIGQLAMALMIRHFIAHGHKAILLVGGATGMIGDPDGKAEERDLKSLEEVVNNKNAITAQYQKFFKGLQFDVVDNYDWFKDLTYLAFLRDIGKHFSMTQLLDRDFVQQRIGKNGAGISYAEFSYSLIQGYDFLHLFRTHGATLQVAGADQWGNSISGVQLIRKLEHTEAHVWTAPLVVNKTTGKKFGKTEEGAIWLDEKKTSPYKFYQFLLNTNDTDVIEYLKIYTLLSHDEIDQLAIASSQEPTTRKAQKVLAFEVTKMVHGEARALAVQRVTHALFGKDDFIKLTAEDIKELVNELPSVAKTQVSSIIEAMIELKLAHSKSEARRLIESGGVLVNGHKITENQPLEVPCLVKKGKNSFGLVV